jgi:hypothetical protein
LGRAVVNEPTKGFYGRRTAFKDIFIGKGGYFYTHDRLFQSYAWIQVGIGDIYN